MPKYVIEREVPAAGKLSASELEQMAAKSCDVLHQLGSTIQWQHSYVTDDKIYCVYIADDEETVREHARRGGFPANRISRVSSTIDPATAEPARRTAQRSDEKQGAKRGRGADAPKSGH